MDTSVVTFTQEEIVHAVQRGAEDGVFFSEFFFSGDCRQPSPKFHHSLWRMFDTNRFSNAKIFRGGAKTTLARHRVGRRVAYGFGHTILFVGKSEGHAQEHVLWLQSQVEYNPLFSQTFNLEPGTPWTGTDIQIWHRTQRYPIRVMGLGILGSIRGINIAGFRPDTIVVDDPCDEENTATADGRKKLSDVFFGGIVEALAPASEDPTASLALLQTPLAHDDLTDLCSKRRDFATMTVGVMDEAGVPAWPERWSKDTIEREREASIDVNQLSIWTREKMCTIIAREASEFTETWLQRWVVLPLLAIYVGAIDPAPVQSERSRLQGTKTDQQAIVVCAYWRGKKYIVEYATARDQDPDAVGREMERFQSKYPIRMWGVETTAYQRTLKWFLEREMAANRLRRMNIIEVNTSAQSKFERIRLAHIDRASKGNLYCHDTHTEYMQQFREFPNCRFKDLLDATSMCDYVVPPGLEQGYGGEVTATEDIQNEYRACP